MVALIIGFIAFVIWIVASNSRTNGSSNQEIDDDIKKEGLIICINLLRMQGISGGYKGDLKTLSIMELEELLEKSKDEQQRKEQNKRLSEEHFRYLEESRRSEMYRKAGINIPTSNLPHTPKQDSVHLKKRDWLKFKEYLQQKGVVCFYHFTDRSNIASIKSQGGLYSWKYCEDNSISIPKAGGDTLSRDLDTRYGLENYVRLSFCCDHPMAYRLKQSGYDLVLLKIKVDVAWLEGTLFSDMNATDCSHSHGATLSDLERIDISATQECYVSSTSPNFKKHQAEILVKRFVSIEYIENIDNPIEL